MGHEVTLGGDRLGSGNKNKIHLHGYERSNHNLTHTWKSSMACGTVVPFWSELALPGDTFDIELFGETDTKPTIGPLYGSFKQHYDLFMIPISPYNAKMHINLLGVGLDIQQIKFPLLDIPAEGLVDPQEPIDNQQINASSIFSYLDIRGLGATNTNLQGEIKRQFQGVTFLGYWDCIKCYYANKQEQLGFVIHKNINAPDLVISEATFRNQDGTTLAINFPPDPDTPVEVQFGNNAALSITCTAMTSAVTANQFILRMGLDPFIQEYPINEVFMNITIDTDNAIVFCTSPTLPFILDRSRVIQLVKTIATADSRKDGEPTLVSYPLSNIDDMRKAILADVNNTNAFTIDASSPSPYNLPFQKNSDTPAKYSKQFNQEGLAVRTYASDLFNNWLETESIDGTGGINDITSIDTTGGGFTMDELSMSQKIYKYLNRIAVSDGTLASWQKATYDVDLYRPPLNPVYLGGLIKNIVFEEIISNSASGNQPLGTLAGRGRNGNKHHGGKVIFKANEPCFILGLTSIVPNIEYSQGNKWHNNLLTMDDLHKPQLDEIGFQDLITDQMAWWGTTIGDAASGYLKTFRSAGKQPAWTNYMTNVDQVRGNFADSQQEMFMVLNRRYGFGLDAMDPTIADLTTYIDPTKFNNIFSDTRLDAQNFWAQIGIKVHARRKMSAKVMPNL